MHSLVILQLNTIVLIGNLCIKQWWLFMEPHLEKPFNVSCENGFEGTLLSNDFGITFCLYAYSHVSFRDNQALAELSAKHHHWLRGYMLGQSEASPLLSAID